MNQDELRQRAERVLEQSPQQSGLLHQLHVHQVELEMQNEELRRSQVELEAARQRYFELYEWAPVGYCTLNARNQILQANLAAATLLGLARSALIEQPIHRFIAQADQDTYYHYGKELFDSRQPLSSELRMVRADGQPFWAQLQATVMLDEERGPLCNLVLSDISQRKRAEAAEAEASQAFVQGLLNSQLDPMAVLDAHGFIVGVNQAWQRFARENGAPWLADDSLGRNYLRVCDQSVGDAEAAAAAAGLRAVLSGQQAAFELEYPCHSPQQQRWFRMHVVALQDSRPGAVVSHTNISAARRAEEALRDSEARFRSAFQYSAMGMALIAPTGKYLKVNSSFCALLGYTEDELLTMNWQDITQVADLDEQLALVRQMLAREMNSCTLTKRYLHKGGHILWVIVAFSLVTGTDGHPAYIVCQITDITEKVRVEQQNAQLEAQLQHAMKMQSVGRLAGGVAHDFNNMLGVILGHTELAIDQMPPSHPVLDDLQEIRQAAERSAGLTRQLLAFARKQTVAPTVLDLNQAVASMLTMLATLLGENVRVNWQPAADLWPIKFDSSQLEQIVTNLCVNARDAIADVGTIAIDTANCAIDAETCANHPDRVPGDYVRLTVSDTGCGMDQATLGQIFEPFFTTKEVGVGTGLGLATVYGSVRQNRGFISVSSQPGQGTTFEVYLPRHLTQQSVPPTQAVPVLGGQETILLVEDEPAVLRLTARVLKAQGYAVLQASSPDQALRLAQEHRQPIHLLVTDVVMPEMNGQQLAQTLLGQHPHLKRMFMSGYTADVIARHGVLDDGVSFLQKPFSVKELAAKVRQALDT